MRHGLDPCHERWLALSRGWRGAMDADDGRGGPDRFPVAVRLVLEEVLAGQVAPGLLRLAPPGGDAGGASGPHAAGRPVHVACSRVAFPRGAPLRPFDAVWTDVPQGRLLHVLLNDRVLWLLERALRRRPSAGAIALVWEGLHHQAVRLDSPWTVCLALVTLAVVDAVSRTLLDDEGVGGGAAPPTGDPHDAPLHWVGQSFNLVVDFGRRRPRMCLAHFLAVRDEHHRRRRDDGAAAVPDPRSAPLIGYAVRRPPLPRAAPPGGEGVRDADAAVVIDLRPTIAFPAAPGADGRDAALLRLHRRLWSMVPLPGTLGGVADLPDADLEAVCGRAVSILPCGLGGIHVHAFRMERGAAPPPPTGEVGGRPVVTLEPREPGPGEPSCTCHGVAVTVHLDVLDGAWAAATGRGAGVWHRGVPVVSERGPSAGPDEAPAPPTLWLAVAVVAELIVEYLRVQRRPFTLLPVHLRLGCGLPVDGATLFADRQYVLGRHDALPLAVPDGGDDRGRSRRRKRRRRAGQ